MSDWRGDMSRRLSSRHFFLSTYRTPVESVRGSMAILQRRLEQRAHFLLPLSRMASQVLSAGSRICSRVIYHALHSKLSPGFPICSAAGRGARPRSAILSAPLLTTSSLTCAVWVNYSFPVKPTRILESRINSSVRVQRNSCCSTFCLNTDFSQHTLFLAMFAVS